VDHCIPYAERVLLGCCFISEPHGAIVRMNKRAVHTIAVSRRVFGIAVELREG
jgi:hypothetical protein